jgi:HEAT repeat protein
VLDALRAGRLEAAVAVARITGDARPAVDVLIDVLNGRNPGAEAAVVDGRLRPNELLRTRAAERLAELGDRSAVPALIAALNSDTVADAGATGSDTIAGAAAAALVELGAVQSIPAMARRLADAEAPTAVRRGMAEALGRFGPAAAAAREALAFAGCDPDRRLRAAAMEVDRSPL